MDMINKKFLVLTLVFFSGCSGMKVIHPNQENKNAGTKAIDWSSGSPKLVSTYSCNVVASNGKRVVAIGNTEADARKEALAKCRDQTLISFCQEDKVSCVAN